MAKTWLFGLSTITIATSGCQSRVFTDGLCRKCYDHCKPLSNSGNDGNRSAPITHSEHNRRRHQSDNRHGSNAFGYPCANGTGNFGPGNNLLRSMDDSHLNSINLGCSDAGS